MEHKKRKTKAETKTISNTDTSSFYKLEYLKWFLSILFSILAYIAVAELITIVYHPDVQQAIDMAYKISIIPVGFAPEPTEKLLLIAAFIVFPISLYCFYYLFHKLLKKIKKEAIHTYYISCVIISSTLLLAVTYLCYISPNQTFVNFQSGHDAGAKTNFDFYFSSTFVYDHLYIAMLLLFPVVLINFLYDYKFTVKTNNFISIVKKIFVYSFCLAIIVVAFFSSVFAFPYTEECRFDFNTVYYPVIQVYNGVPLLVNNFITTYGLYPQFLAPVLKLTGLSVLNFSFIMALLVALCFTIILLFLIKNVKSSLLVLFGFTSLFFICYKYGHIVQPFDPYFQMCPIRWLFPVLLILYATLYLQHRSRLKYFLSWILFSLGILWNPDFGIFTYLTLIAFYCYLELENSDVRIATRKIAVHLFSAVIICCSTFLAYAFIIKMFYGSFPELLKIFTNIKAYSFVGFNMLPMPPGFHPWMLIALIYLVGLAHSAYAIFNRSFSNRTSMIFLLSVLGMISFSYYEGRSHNWTLFISNFEAFLLLPVFADDLLLIARKQKTFVFPFSILVFFLFFSFFQIIYDYERITSLIFQKENKAASRDEKSTIIKNAAFIHSLTSEHEKVLIFPTSQYQALYYDLSKTCAAVNPELENLVLKTDFERIKNFIIHDRSTKIFYAPNDFVYFNTDIQTLLATFYDVDKVQENGPFLALKRKQESPNDDFILKQDKADVIHEKFDTKRTRLLPYMNGEKGKIVLGKQFSAEVIFKPVKTTSSLFTNRATLFCNWDNEKGFMLQQNDNNADTYDFYINTERVSDRVVLDKWNYLAYEVNGKSIRVFLNGKLEGVVNYHNEYINSDLPLYLGNHIQKGGYFFGDLKEIRIANGLLNENDIKIATDKIL